MSHTPEPWRVRTDTSAPNVFITREFGVDVPPAFYIAFVQGIGKKEIESNATRIVACVNGCAGLTTEQASNAFATITACNQMLAGMEERDKAYRECVEALRKAHSTISDECEGGVDHPVARLVFDALAHTEGRQP